MVFFVAGEYLCAMGQMGMNHSSFSRSLHNTKMAISPTSFWLCHSKLKRPVKSAAVKVYSFYQLTSNFTFANILKTQKLLCENFDWLKYLRNLAVTLYTYIPQRNLLKKRPHSFQIVVQRPSLSTSFTLTVKTVAESKISSSLLRNKNK